MTKKVKGGKVEIEVTDGGSLKNLSKNAKQAGKDVGSVAKNTAESDRRLKSLSNQTSNTTKGFSKQAQTIQGGLVPVYATLAAQVFAVSAAFRFLQEASNFKNLIAGQEAYGSVTGIMYKSLAKDIREATNAQISYADASQAAAIGIASGLNASQLSALGKAAADVSLVLGRDVTDSFNRLIRGVTKAEPELLDELGIVLRLDPALKNYAAQIGKVKDELNQFERSQAVAAEVIGQAEQKFGKIQQALDPSAFAFNQFGQAFNDVLDSLKVGIGTVAQVVLPFFTNNIGALIGALGLFVLPIAKSILPNFKALEKQSADTVSALKDDIATIKKEQETLNVARGMAGTTDPSALKASAAAALKKDFGIKDKLTPKRVAAFKRSAQLRIGVAKNMNKKELAQFKQHLRNMEIAHKMSLNKQVSAQQAAELKKQSQIKRTELFYKQSMATLTRVTGFAAKAMNKAFMLMGIAGLAVMIFDLGRSFINMFKTVDEEAEAFAEKLEGLADKTSEINKALDDMARIRGQGLVSLADQAKATANAIASIGVAALIQDVLDVQASGEGFRQVMTSTYSTGPAAGTSTKAPSGKKELDPTSDAGKSILRTISAFEKLAKLTADPEAAETFAKFAEELDDGIISDETIKNVINFSNKIMQLNQLASSYTQTQKTATEAQAAFLQKFAPNTPATKSLTAYSKHIDSIQANIDQLDLEIQKSIKGGVLSKDATEEEKAAHQQAVQRRIAFQEEKDNTEIMQGFLRNQIKAEQEHAHTLQLQKTIKAGIRQDGSIEAAQSLRSVTMETKKADILLAQANIKAKEEIIDREGESMSAERLANAEASLLVEKEKLNTLLMEQQTLEDIFDIETQRAINAQKRRAQTAGLTKSNVRIKQAMTDPDKIAKLTAAGAQFEGDEAGAVAHIQKMQTTIESFTIAADLSIGVAERLGQALTDNLGNAILSLVDGTKSFKEAFGDLAKSVLADLFQMTFRAMMFQALLPGNILGGAGAFLGIGGGRYGGIMSPSGKSFRYGGMVAGGIASGPNSGYTATLHGTEAVVPLGNDRSIPVKFEKGAGGINNITVNVNMETGATDMVADETDSKALGLAISMAVKQELELQQRPGGSLRRG